MKIPIFTFKNRYLALGRASCFLLLAIFILSGCSTHYYDKTANKFTRQKVESVSHHYAQLDDGVIEYYHFGHGSPIVLITGYATDVSSWNKEFLTALAVHHQVIVFNNRNVGGSLIASNNYETKDLAEDTYALIKFLHLQKPTVIGISMGGMIAQQLAVLHQSKLGALILINTAIAGKKVIHPSPAVEKELLAMPDNDIGRYIFALKMFFPSGWKTKMAYSLAVDRFLPQDLQKINTAAIKPQQWHLVNQWVKDDVAAKKISHLQLPVLILNGQADSVIPPENSMILTRTIPHATLMRWSEGGHAMIYQFPQQLASSIDDFIEKVS